MVNSSFDEIDLKELLPGIERIIEGGTVLFVPKIATKKGPAAIEGPVFFNPAQAFSRDMTVIFLHAILRNTERKRFHILDGLGGTGARGIRVAKEAVTPFEDDLEIQVTINDKNPVAVALVDEGAAKDYDSEQWGTGTSDICAACHGEYHKIAPGQGSTLDGGSYTHRVDMPYNYPGNVNPETIGFGGYFLPLAESGVNDMVVCMTCHLPHGSSAQMTGITDGAGLPGETSAADSALLRLDNRGVCEVCHQK